MLLLLREGEEEREANFRWREKGAEGGEGRRRPKRSSRFGEREDSKERMLSEKMFGFARFRFSSSSFVFSPLQAKIYSFFLADHSTRKPSFEQENT